MPALMLAQRAHRSTLTGRFSGYELIARTRDQRLEWRDLPAARAGDDHPRRRAGRPPPDRRGRAALRVGGLSQPRRRLERLDVYRPRALRPGLGLERDLGALGQRAK